MVSAANKKSHMLQEVNILKSIIPFLDRSDIISVQAAS